MEPVKNWKLVLQHAWSIKLDILNIILSALVAGIQIFTGTAVIDPVVLAAVSTVVTVLSMTVRFIKQEKVSGPNEPPS